MAGKHGRNVCAPWRCMTAPLHFPSINASPPLFALGLAPPPPQFAHISHHGRPPKLALPLGHPRRHRRQLHSIVHLRCQGRDTGRHLRPSVWCQGGCRQRGHTFPDSVAAKSNCVRCAHAAKEHFNDDRQQGFADGDADAEGAASPRGQAIAQDLPGMHVCFHVL